MSGHLIREADSVTSIKCFTVAWLSLAFLIEYPTIEAGKSIIKQNLIKQNLIFTPQSII